jgi:MraZ protein
MSQNRAPILGLHHKKLDKFDRIVLPRNICKALGDGKPVVMVPWLDRSIALFNAQDFRTLTDRFCGNRRKRFRADRRMLIRYLGSYASKVTYDRQGRIAIPESLRKWAYIGTDVTILGTFDMAEIFSTPVYEKLMDEGKLNFDTALEEALCEEEFGEALPGEPSGAEDQGELEMEIEETPEENG